MGALSLWHWTIVALAILAVLIAPGLLPLMTGAAGRFLRQLRQGAKDVSVALRSDPTGDRDK